jgi:hypothetical protein
VWHPQTWQDIVAARGVVAEAPDLDFKSKLTSNNEIAKDVAAMTLEGGVIAYGLLEDDQAVLKEITAIELSQVPEKIQQIVDSAIWPSPEIEIEAIADPSDATRGVVVIHVPPSSLVPHYANDRFPARSGRTTRYLTEREIASYYDQRRALFASAQDTPVLGEHLDPIDAPGGIRGIGVLRMVVAPIAPARHPAGLHLRRPLAAAVGAAAESLAWLGPTQLPAAFDYLASDWRPRGSIGWEGGHTSDDFQTLRSSRTVTGTCTHDLTLSFLATLGLEGEDGEGFCAYEQIWAAEALAFISIAGHFFRGVPGGSILRADVSMRGLDGAVSWALSRGMAFHTEQLRAADTDYRERTQTNPSESVSQPIEVARRLLDRLLISFVPEETDVFVRLKSTV